MCYVDCIISKNPYATAHTYIDIIYKAFLRGGLTIVWSTQEKRVPSTAAGRQHIAQQ